MVPSPLLFYLNVIHVPCILSRVHSVYSVVMYGQPAPTRSSSNPLKILLIIVVFIGIPCLIGGYFLFNIAKGSMKMVSESIMPTASCAMNFDFVQQAAMQYVGANSGKLPSADKWQSDIEPYYRKLSEKMGKERAEVMGAVFEMKPFPKDGQWACKHSDVTTGIAMNKAIAGKKMADIADKSVAMFFETEKPGTNLVMDFVSPPAAKAPKMMGKSREWLRVNLDGTGNVKSVTQNSNFKIDAGKTAPK
jgi:hypothetical protein